jgi:hypothetical protein
VTDDNLISSNVPETDHAAWNSGTTYGLGDRVIVVATHYVYESVQASNTNNDPVVDSALETPLWWVRVGATNRWKPFDRVIQDQCSQADIISNTIFVASNLDTVALFNLEAESVRVAITPDAEARRNLFLATAEIDNATYWGDTASFKSLVADPDGGTSAVRFQVGSFYAAILVQELDAPTTEPGVWSCWVRATAPDTVRLVEGVDVLLGGYTIVVASFAVTTTWTRVSVAVPFINAEGFFIETIGANNIECYKPQFETASSPTDYQRILASGLVDPGPPIFDETQETQDYSVIGIDTSWFDYFTAPIERSDQLLFTDLRAFTGGNLVIDVESPGGTPKVGEIVFGRSEYIGETHAGAEIGIESYSRNDRDTFGNVTIIKRPYADTMNLTFHFPADRMAYTRRLLGRLESTGIVIHNGAAALNFGLMTYGFYNNFTLPMTTAEHCFAKMEIKSLI